MAHKHTCLSITTVFCIMPSVLTPWLFWSLIEVPIPSLAQWDFCDDEAQRGRKHFVLGHESIQVTTEKSAVCGPPSDLVAISKCCSLKNELLLYLDL